VICLSLTVYVVLAFCLLQAQNEQLSENKEIMNVIMRARTPVSSSTSSPILKDSQLRLQDDDPSSPAGTTLSSQFSPTMTSAFAPSSLSNSTIIETIKSLSRNTSYDSLHPLDNDGSDDTALQNHHRDEEGIANSNAGSSDNVDALLPALVSGSKIVKKLTQRFDHSFPSPVLRSPEDRSNNK
jgi:hypothetical protein